jgi:thiol:disulfide interchange protein DsbC
MLKRTYLWLVLLSWLGVAQADNAEVEKNLQAVMPGITFDSLRALDNTGLYETVINGEILYFSADGRYAFQGDVIALETRENITENQRLKLRKEKLASLNETEMIVYEPEETKHTLTVFTDIDCGYCRKLHNQMDDYNKLGIRIRYMAFPRAGIDSDSYDKAENVWCAEDRKQAMTDAKNGKTVNSKNCSTPVKAQYQVGRQLGVQGTPALFLESGEMLPGYVPPARLKQLLDEKVAAS